MNRFIEATAFEIVANPPDDREAKGELRRFAKTTETAMIFLRLLGYGVHDWDQLGPQSRKEFVYRSCRHALIRFLDQGIGDMVIGGQKSRHTRGQGRYPSVERGAWSRNRSQA